MTTPTKLRRSISTGDVSVNPSPVLKMTSKEDRDESVVETLQARISELELQLEDAMQKLVADDTVVVKCSQEEEMKLRIEQMEAEMETYKAELKLREEEQEKAEKLVEQLDSLKVNAIKH